MDSGCRLLSVGLYSPAICPPLCLLGRSFGQGGYLRVHHWRAPLFDIMNCSNPGCHTRAYRSSFRISTSLSGWKSFAWSCMLGRRSLVGRGSGRNVSCVDFGFCLIVTFPAGNCCSLGFSVLYLGPVHKCSQKCIFIHGQLLVSVRHSSTCWLPQAGPKLYYPNIPCTVCTSVKGACSLTRGLGVLWRTSSLCRLLGFCFGSV